MPIRIVLKEESKTPFPIGIIEPPSSPLSTSSNAGSHPRRSSILRPTTEQLIRESEMPINDDISVSSRLSGYFFTFISYLVLLVSTTLSEDNNEEEMESDKITKSEWKQDMTLFGSVTFLVLTFFIILVHFDTWLCPKFWWRIFRSGSKWEGMILICTMLLSLSIVFASTTSDGLGGFAALNYNVYILSWLGLLLTIYTFNLWLVSGVRSKYDVPNRMHM
jgi:magnesium-transporting ATPase (P-type)